MKYFKYIYSIFIFFLSLFLSSCMLLGLHSFGTKSEILNENAVETISMIYVLPVIIDDQNVNKTDLPPTDSIQVWFKQNISSRKFPKSLNFKFGYSEGVINDSTNSNSINKSDAFLISKITFAYRSLGDNSALLSLNLIDPKTEEVIAFCSHDTYIGNNYFLPPPFETSTKDAIDGALNEFENLFED